MCISDSQPIIGGFPPFPSGLVHVGSAAGSIWPLRATSRAQAEGGMLRCKAADLDAGYAVWKRILWAVEELQGAKPKSGEAVH